MPVRVLVISGSMGSGKTAVLGELSDLLSEQGQPHATIDLDAIGSVLLPDAAARDLVFRNLAALYANMVDAGLRHLLLAEAVETREELEDLQQAMPGAELVLCRLTAGVDEMARRIRLRETGMYQQRFVERSRLLHHVLEAAKLESFVVSNDGRSITDVARDVLSAAGWGRL